MAATITQTPNLTASAYTPMVYVVDGLTTEDRYVLRVNIGGTPVATFKQPANPSGVGIFDISKVLQSYFGDAFVEETVQAADTINAYQTYQVEAWLETGQTPGAVITDQQRFAINAYDNWRSLGGNLTPFLLNPSSVICETPGANVNAVYSSEYSFLTNYPGTYTVRPDEWKTLSFISKNMNIGPNWGPNEAPFFVRITTNNEEIVYSISADNGSSLRANCQDMTVSLTDDNAITTIGAGPANIASLLSVPFSEYQIRVYSYNHCITTTIADCNDFGEILIDGYLGDVIFSANFEVDNSCEKFEPITVSFMNQYGVRDYYTFTKRNTRQVQTQRNEYSKSNGSWSSTSFAIDQTGRGRTVFSSTAETEMTMSTDWMSDATSEWLQELFVSPSTMIYYKGQWEPVVITTATYDEKTYARQQLFQHEITVRFANNQKIQRG